VTPTPPPLSSPQALIETTEDFRYACEDCAYFVPDLDACAHGYPTTPHKRGALTIVFCKEFELA